VKGKTQSSVSSVTGLVPTQLRAESVGGVVGAAVGGGVGMLVGRFVFEVVGTAVGMAAVLQGVQSAQPH